MDNLTKNAKMASQVMKEKIHFSSENTNVAKWGVDERKKADDVSVETMISFLKEIDTTLQSPIADVSFPNRNLILGRSLEEKYYENSDGSKLVSRVPRFFYAGTMLALYHGKPTSISVPPGYCGLGGTGGWEIVEDLNLVDYVPSGVKEITAGIKVRRRNRQAEKRSMSFSGRTCLG